MKAILKFELPEEKDDFKMAVNGHRAYFTIMDFINHLRYEMKHGDLTEAEYKIYENLFDKFHELIDDNNLNLEEIE